MSDIAFEGSHDIIEDLVNSSQCVNSFGLTDFREHINNWHSLFLESSEPLSQRFNVIIVSAGSLASLHDS